MLDNSGFNDLSIGVRFLDLGMAWSKIDFVLDITALAVKTEQLTRDLWVYKNGRSDDVRRTPQLVLAAVLWRSLAVHERCLAAAAVGDCLVSYWLSRTFDEERPFLFPVEPFGDSACHRYGALICFPRPRKDMMEGHQMRWQSRRWSPTPPVCIYSSSMPLTLQ